MPRFRKANAQRGASLAWGYERRAESTERREAATKKMFDKHEAEREAKAKGAGAE